MESIPFLVAERQNVKGIFSGGGVIVKANVPVATLKSNLSSVSNALLGVLQDIKEVGQFKLKEVVVQVEVTAEGGIEFIGTATLGAKGAITLHFGNKDGQ